MIPPGFLEAAARRRATPWLLLAAAAVALSGVFALLIALARVPALGALFPGDGFYRVALTLHVTFSQGAWFMAFAALLWSLHGGGRRVDTALCLLAAAALLGLVAALPAGEAVPVMSNYFPVLDGPLFLGAAALFVAVFAANAVRALLPEPAPAAGSDAGARWVALGLRVVAMQAMVAIGLAVHAAAAQDFSLAGPAQFEALFWAAGHAWQYALVTLMMACWLLAASVRLQSARLAVGVPLLALAVLPTLLSLLAAVRHAPLSEDYFAAFTTVMQRWSWQAPVALAVLLLAVDRRLRGDPLFLLTLALFAGGLLLGTQIDGQTTLVTAHYHGTIGAVTLAFMRVAADLAAAWRGPSAAARGALWYGAGVLAMMGGLAGAGWAGAPRKVAGDLSLALSPETISRLFLGLGGALATAGLALFAGAIVLGCLRRRRRSTRA